MLYGFIDESGSPGMANGITDYIGIALVIIKDKPAVEKIIREIQRLRQKLNLSRDYEFHLSRNTKTTRRHFIKFLTDLDFRYAYVYTPKDHTRGTGAYRELVKKLFVTISTLTDSILIKMDDNPTLYAEIRKASKNFPLKISCKQVHSKNSDLVQIADYIAGMPTKELKGKRTDPAWHQIKKLKRLR